MHDFIENMLIRELGELPLHLRVAFAAAAATRQLSNYERLAKGLQTDDIERPRAIVTELWSALKLSEIDRAVWSARLEEVMELLPGEGEYWTTESALADDAISSLAYSIRCLMKADPQEAAWAARCAYEAADQAAIDALQIQPGRPDSELAIKSHIFVQRELARQKNDLVLLRTGLMDEVQRDAFANELLTAQEAASLPQNAIKKTC